MITDTPPPLRFGIIGCGRIAPRHAQAMASIPAEVGLHLVACCDLIESRARHFASSCGIPTEAVYTDARALLARPDLDVVSVCVPSGLHAEIGVLAAQAGKHVLMEKPIALTLEDADRLIAACAEHSVRLGVVLQNRFNPPMRELKALVEGGDLGRVVLGAVTVRWFRPQSYYEDGWHGTLAMDGGALLNQSIHHIDALQWLLGEVEQVFAYTGTLAHTMEAEDVGVATLRFRSGALATVEGSTVTYPENLEASIALFGEHGSVKVGGTALNRWVFWKVAGRLEEENFKLRQQEIDPPSVYGYSHREQILEMAAAIRQGRAPSTHGGEARRSLALVMAMMQSAREGRAVGVAY